MSGCSASHPMKTANLIEDMELTLQSALQTADAHIARFAAQTSPTFPVEFDDPDEEDDDEEDGMAAITRANAEDGEQPE